MHHVSRPQIVTLCVVGGLLVATLLWALSSGTFGPAEGPLASVRAPLQSSNPVAQSPSAVAPWMPPDGLEQGAASTADVSRTELSSADGAGAEAQPPEALEGELESALASFYGAHPDLDALRNLLPELASRAVPDLETVVREDGETRGTFTIEGTSLQGTFSWTAQACSIRFQQSCADKEYFLRSFSVQTKDEAGQLSGGAMNVQHFLNAQDPATLSRIADAPQVVGWLVESTRATGTVATPVQATATEAGSALTVSAAASADVPAIQQEWAWDLGGFEAWRNRLSEWR